MCPLDPQSDLDGEHGDALGAVDAVPDAQVPSVLSHHHITAGNPLHVRAETQQRGLHTRLYVVQVELRRKEEASKSTCGSLLFKICMIISRVNDTRFSSGSILDVLSPFLGHTE